MKKHLLFVVCICVLSVWASSTASAQQASGSLPGLGSASSWPSPEELVAKMDQELSLSDQQKTKLLPIITNRQEQLKALANDTTDTPRVKAHKLKFIHDSSELNIYRLLNKVQKQKYAAMEQQMRNQAMQRGQQRRANAAQR